jgi:hypothetical protein
VDEEHAGGEALYSRVPHPAAVTEAFECYDRWIQQSGCDGPGDPRVLPLHVFGTTSDWSYLGDPEVCKKFEKVYGKPAGARTDDDGKVWRRGAHGRDRLTVAGYELGPGMHWDVNTAGSTATIMNGLEIWQLGKRHGYLNVSPDAHFRKGSSLSTAKKVWP